MKSFMRGLLIIYLFYVLSECFPDNFFFETVKGNKMVYGFMDINF